MLGIRQPANFLRPPRSPRSLTQTAEGRRALGNSASFGRPRALSISLSTSQPHSLTHSLTQPSAYIHPPYSYSCILHPIHHPFIHTLQILSPALATFEMDHHSHMSVHTAPTSPESKGDSPSGGDFKPRLRVVERGSQACNECRRHKVCRLTMLYYFLDHTLLGLLDLAASLSVHTASPTHSPIHPATLGSAVDTQIRCHPAADDPDHHKPCARCVRMSLECVFKKHNRGRKRKNPYVPLHLRYHFIPRNSHRTVRQPTAQPSRLRPSNHTTSRGAASAIRHPRTGTEAPPRNVLCFPRCRDTRSCRSTRHPRTWDQVPAHHASPSPCRPTRL